MRKLSLFLLFMLISLPASAAVTSLEECAPGFREWDFTSKVVYCVQTTVMQATFTVMNGLSQFMLPIVGATLTLALVVFGMRVAGGEADLKSKGFGFCIRIGIVLAFSYNLGGIANAIFGFANDLMMWVTGGYSPWAQIDGFVGKLFGFGQNIALTQGLVGIIGMAAFSSTPGIMLTMVGLIAMVELLFFVYKVVMVYLLAITIIGFMICLSPIIVPLALFNHSERHVTRWMHIMVSAMITPAILFAFLWMFMDIFTVLVTKVFAAFGVDDFRSFWRLDQPMFSWVMPADPNMAHAVELATEKDPDSSLPAVQTFMNPFANRGMEMGGLNMRGVHFGQNNVGITQQLIFDLTSLLIFAWLMKEMIHKIPSVADSIAQTGGKIVWDGSSAMDKIKGSKQMVEGAKGSSETIKNVKEQMGLMAGNRAGPPAQAPQGAKK